MTEEKKILIISFLSISLGLTTYFLFFSKPSLNYAEKFGLEYKFINSKF